MKRREATPEQKERARQRREQFRALSKKLGEMSPEERQRFAESHPVANCEGHVLSVFNQCFILSQSSGASLVGGFQQWRKQGRCVKKGAVGLAIWIPTTRKKDDAPALPDGVTVDPDENPHFMLGYVFDVADTEALQAVA